MLKLAYHHSLRLIHQLYQPVVIQHHINSQVLGESGRMTVHLHTSAYFVICDRKRLSRIIIHLIYCS